MTDTKTEALEIRSMPFVDCEMRVVRADDGKPTKIEGYAAVFDRDSLDLGGFIEQIAPGSFKNALGSSDVRALVNHDSNLLLGRTKSNTLSLKEDTRGLLFAVDLPDTQIARDTAESVARGDMDGCSFSFTVKEHEWAFTDDETPDRRRITEVGELFDVGPVTYPAYPDTSVATRSYEAAKAEKRDVEPATEEPAEPVVEEEAEPVVVEPEDPEAEDERMLADAKLKTKKLARLHIDLTIK